MKKNNKKKTATNMCGDRGATWVGCYERVTPTKKEKVKKADRKHRNKMFEY